MSTAADNSLWIEENDKEVVYQVTEILAQEHASTDMSSEMYQDVLDEEDNNIIIISTFCTILFLLYYLYNGSKIVYYLMKMAIIKI